MSTPMKQAGHYPTSGATPNATPETEPPYKQISLIRSGLPLFGTILANCSCIGLICVSLWRFEKLDNFNKWEKRGFNTLILLLSAALGFGIGFLFNQIGLLSRGKVLTCGRYSKEAVGHILKGSLAAYSRLFNQQVRSRRGRFTQGTFVLALYLLCSLLGRFGVASLGLTFNLDDSTEYKPPLYTPEWDNAVLRRDNSIQTALEKKLGITANGQNTDARRTALTDGDVTGEIFQIGQAEKGPPWFVSRNSVLPYMNDTKATTFAMDIRNMQTANLTMEVSDDNTVLYNYKFQDFLGAANVFARSRPPAVWKTRCQKFEGPVEDILLYTTNLTAYPRTYSYPYRWISPLPSDKWNSSNSSDSSSVHLFPNATLQMWLFGQSGTYQSLEHLVLEHSYVANSIVIFNCSVSFDYEMIHPTLLDQLKYSLVLPVTGIIDRSDSPLDLEVFRDFSSTLEFDFGVSRQDRSASALWLSAYIGNYIGNCLGSLNDVLDRRVIAKETNTPKTTLEVKWPRVAATLGALAGFQVLFVLAALWYCSGSLQIVDNLVALSTMLTTFPDGIEEPTDPGQFNSNEDDVSWKFTMDEIVGLFG